MKGQFTWDYIVSIAAFIAIVAYLSLQMINKAPSTLDTIRAEYLRSEAYQISEQLINNPGYPQDWETLQLSSLTDLVWQETNVLDTQASINSIAIGDVDGDSKNDIVAVTNAEVLQLKQINNKWTSALIGNVPGGKTVAIGNVMLDSGNEIVVGALQTGSPNLVLYNYSGIGLGFNPPVSIATLNININSVAIGNVDNDLSNTNEIVVNNLNELKYYKNVSTPIWEAKTIKTMPTTINSIAMEDADNAGKIKTAVGLQSPTQFELRYYKDSIARLGLSNADKDVTNYLSFPKINAFNLSCTSNYGDVATLLGLDVNKYNFSITLIDITNPDPPLINCYPSTSLTRSINTTLSRYVTLDNGDVGEMIIQIW